MYLDGEAQLASSPVLVVDLEFAHLIHLQCLGGLHARNNCCWSVLYTSIALSDWACMHKKHLHVQHGARSSVDEDTIHACWTNQHLDARMGTVRTFDSLQRLTSAKGQKSGCLPPKST